MTESSCWRPVFGLVALLSLGAWTTDCWGKPEEVKVNFHIKVSPKDFEASGGVDVINKRAPLPPPKCREYGVAIHTEGGYHDREDRDRVRMTSAQFLDEV